MNILHQANFKDVLKEQKLNILQLIWGKKINCDKSLGSWNLYQNTSLCKGELTYMITKMQVRIAAQNYRVIINYQNCKRG